MQSENDKIRMKVLQDIKKHMGLRRALKLKGIPKKGLELTQVKVEGEPDGAPELPGSATPKAPEAPMAPQAPGLPDEDRQKLLQLYSKLK